MNSIFFLLIAVCAALSFFFSGMEAGVFALSRLRVRRLARAGRTNAKRLSRYLDNPEEFLWTILVGNTLANFTFACAVVLGSENWIQQHPILFAIGFAVGALLFYGGCELLPKMVFRHYPNRLCLALSAPFGALQFLLRPAVAVVRWVASGFLHWTGGRTFTGRLFASRDELRVLMQQSAQELSSEERGMINRVLDIQNVRIEQIFVPMSRAVTVVTTTPVKDALAICRERAMSRLPVWEREGTRQRVTGIFNLRSLLYRAELDPNKTVGDYVKPAAFLDVDMRLDEALRHLQRAGQRLAIVLDRDGREAGVVSLQDILQIIFGKVRL